VLNYVHASALMQAEQMTSNKGVLHNTEGFIKQHLGEIWK